MEVQLMMPPSPSPAPDFNFDSACTSPYISAPSSPQRFGTFFFSAPASPSRAPLSSSVPFDWEETPGTPKHKPSSSSSAFDEYDESKDFAFDFSGHLDGAAPFSAADELFDGGKIKPLKPPPGSSGNDNSSYPLSPKSPRSPKKILKEALSFKQARGKGPAPGLDPFEVAMETTRKETEPLKVSAERGRERTQAQNPVRSKGTRSLSPFRVSDLLMEQEMGNDGDKNVNANVNGSFSSFWTRKWKLRDLLLFRSASEGTGRASSVTKDELNKFSLLRKASDSSEDVRNSSFRSTDSVGSSVSSSKRRGQVSAHELHYTANRAVSEELKRKTFLPYRPGLFGCLGFSRGIPIQEISRNLGSIHRV